MGVKGEEGEEISRGGRRWGRRQQEENMERRREEPMGGWEKE